MLLLSHGPVFELSILSPFFLLLGWKWGRLGGGGIRE